MKTSSKAPLGNEAAGQKDPKIEKQPAHRHGDGDQTEKHPGAPWRAIVPRTLFHAITSFSL